MSVIDAWKDEQIGMLKDMVRERDLRIEDLEAELEVEQERAERLASTLRNLREEISDTRGGAGLEDGAALAG